MLPVILADAVQVYFLVIPHPKAGPLPTDKTERERLLMSYQGVALELTFNHGTDTDPDFKGYDSGNNEPKRGFGHLALHCDDVYESAAALEARGVVFRKRPDEGRMKGIAFFYDPGENLLRKRRFCAHSVSLW